MTTDLSIAPQYRHTIHMLEGKKRVNSQGDDYWTARDIHVLLGYPVWDKFLPVIERAEQSIRTHGGEPSHHIAHTSKMVGLGDGAKRRVKEFFLSRGACYLIAMNGDPNKPEIAGAQAYFATQTRQAELAESESEDRKRLLKREKVTAAVKRVGAAAKDAGVQRYALFNNARYLGLYGHNKRDVDRMKGLQDGEELLDRAGTLELSAHEFQMELAAAKIVNEGINGERNAIEANLAVAQDVRKTVQNQGFELESVPLEKEHIRAIRKRLASRLRIK